MPPKKIRNMDELAKVSGISRPTLSKYFNDAASVRDSTRAKVEKALQVFDFRPNVYAINQNRRRTRNIGIIVPYLADPFFTEIGREVELACIRAGYSPILLSSHGSPELELDNLESLRSLKPAGVLLAPCGDTSDKRAIEEFAREIPVVLFDSNIADIGEAFVGSNNGLSIALMVQYLCRSGQPPCFFEMKTPSNPNALTRRQAYLDSMARQGEPAHIFQVEGDGWNFEEIGSTEGGRLLSQGAFPTNTVLCSNDRLAIGMLAAAYKQNIRVGLDEKASIRIAGHDDHPFARYTCPPLTTIAQDYIAIAQGAADILFQIIDTEIHPSSRVETLLEGRLIMRDSA
jgi:DNA-binding LacI/PurR family transcriptional regulator